MKYCDVKRKTTMAFYTYIFYAPKLTQLSFE